MKLRGVVGPSRFGTVEGKGCSDFWSGATIIESVR